MVKAVLEEIKFEKNIGKFKKTLLSKENKTKSTLSGIKVKKKYLVIAFE